MKKTIKGLLVAFMAIIAFNAVAQDKSFEFYFKDFAIKPGEQKQIELYLKNNFLGQDFQVQMFFPEGLTPVLDEDEEAYLVPEGRCAKLTFAEAWNDTTSVRRLRLVAVQMKGKSYLEAGDAPIAYITVKASENYNSKQSIEVKALDPNEANPAYFCKLNWKENGNVYTVVGPELRAAAAYPAMTLPWILANGVEGGEYGIADPVAVLCETSVGAFIQDAAYTPMKVNTSGNEWGIVGAAAESIMGTYNVVNGNPCITTPATMAVPEEDATVTPAVKEMVLNNVLFNPEANEIVKFNAYYRASDAAACAYSTGNQGQCIALNWAACLEQVPTDGTYFQLLGPAQLKMTWAAAEATEGMTGKKGPGAWKNYVVYPVMISTDVPTGVNDVAAKTVAGVKYVNAAGVESATPFEGVNIVVTTYTDGTMSAVKEVK